MQTIDLTDEELTAVTSAARRVLVDDGYPLSPRMAPLRNAIEKLRSAIGETGRSR
jgi:hypothetical protein